MASLVQHLPLNIPESSLRSFVATGALSLFSGRTLQVSMVNGAISVLASVVEAVTRPIVAGILKNFPNLLIPFQIILSRKIALGIASAVAPPLGLAYAVNDTIVTFLGYYILNDNPFGNKQALTVIL